MPRLKTLTSTVFKCLAPVHRSPWDVTKTDLGSAGSKPGVDLSTVKFALGSPADGLRC